MRTIVVLAAHPDDEALGVGGTITRHAAAGDKVHVVVAAEGVTSRDPARDPQSRRADLEQLQHATHKAAKELGVSSVRFLGFPDNRCDSVDRLDLIKAIEVVVVELQPSTVYVHHSGDVNIDHRLLNEAAITACRPQPNQPVTRLLAYETVSSTEWAPAGCMPAFQPNVFIDISPYWPQKRAALQAYQAEMRNWPHARSIRAVEHLGCWRGASVGMEMAEAFMLLRDIQRL